MDLIYFSDFSENYETLGNASIMSLKHIKFSDFELLAKITSASLITWLKVYMYV